MLLAGGLSLVVVASLGDAARRRRPLAWHAYIPWHALLFGGVTAVVLLAAHLFALWRG